MNKQFASNALLIVVLNLLVKSFYLFGIDRTVQNILPEGEYGLYFTLFNFAFLFQIISDFGLQNYNARHLASSRQLLSKYFPYLLGLKLILGLVFVLVVVVSGYVWGFQDTTVWWLLGGIAINQLLQSLVLFLRSNLAGLGLYRLDSFASVLDKSFLVIIASVLLWTPELRPNFELYWFVLAHSAAYLMTIIILYSLLKPKLTRPRIRLEWTKVAYFLKASAPFALVIFLMTAYTRLDAIMIEKLLPDGLVQVDRYASAFRLLDAANVAGFLLAGLLLPMFARQLKEKENINPLVKLAISTIWTGAISLAIAMYAFAVPVMHALYVDANADSITIVRWLMLTFIPMSGGYVYGTLLTANGNLKRMNIIFAISIILNIALNLYLIPIHGASGAAFATFTTQSMAFIAQLFLAHQLLDLKLDKLLWMRFGLFTSGLILTVFIMETQFAHRLLLVKFISLVLVGIILAVALKLLDVKSWIKIKG